MPDSWFRCADWKAQAEAVAPTYFYMVNNCVTASCFYDCMSVHLFSENVDDPWLVKEG